MPQQIELLYKEHDRSRFDCGEPSLNEWLQRMALQQQAKNYARTRVIVDSYEPPRILGYYALLPTQIDTIHFPSGRKLPRRLPCLLLGRLAVDQTARGRRIGELLLVDAIERTYRSIGEIGGAGLYADALNDRAKAFYTRYGFQPMPDDRGAYSSQSIGRERAGTAGFPTVSREQVIAFLERGAALAVTEAAREEPNLGGRRWKAAGSEATRRDGALLRVAGIRKSLNRSLVMMHCRARRTSVRADSS